MDTLELNRMVAALASEAAGGTDATRIADTIVSTWGRIDVALTPILGLRGVAMLYKRSLFLTASHYPWLADAHEGAQTAMDLTVLKSALTRQESIEAAAAGGILLQNFHGLLASLVGPALTEQLLDSVWAHHSSGSPAQDFSP